MSGAVSVRPAAPAPAQRSPPCSPKHPARTASCWRLRVRGWEPPQQRTASNPGGWVGGDSVGGRRQGDRRRRGSEPELEARSELRGNTVRAGASAHADVCQRCVLAAGGLQLCQQLGVAQLALLSAGTEAAWGWGAGPGGTRVGTGTQPPRGAAVHWDAKAAGACVAAVRGARGAERRSPPAGAQSSASSASSRSSACCWARSLACGAGNGRGGRRAARTYRPTYRQLRDCYCWPPH